MIKRIHEFLPNIKDLYSIDEDGNIYSDNCGKMKVRNKPGTEYKIINFQTVEGLKQTFRVHRLVLMAFNPCDNSENFQVNHKDGDKTNNKLSNLEWCTSKENINHAYKHNLIKPRKGEKSNWAKLSYDSINTIKELKRKGLTNKEIGEIVGCTTSNISYILNNKTWQV